MNGTLDLEHITLTREKYIWRSRYVRDPWPMANTVGGFEQIKRDSRRELLFGKLVRTARDRKQIAERWLTRQLRKKGYVVITGTGHEIDLPDLRYGDGWQTPAYSVHAFEKPDNLTWEDAAKVAELPIWKDRHMLNVMPKMEPLVHV